MQLKCLCITEIPAIDQNQQRAKERLGKPYQCLSPPSSRCPHSLLAKQSQPPATPLPFFHSSKGTTAPSFHCAQLVVLEIGSRRMNLLIPQVYVLKSSSHTSSGIWPVKALPMAIMDAACVHINIDVSSSLMVSSLEMIYCIA